MQFANVAVVIPALNESPTIGTVVVEALRSCSHVIVVDDGSNDDTSYVSKSSGALVVRHEVPGGLGAALRSGFDAVLRAGLSHAVTIDGDGAHDPLQIPQLIEAHLSSNADLTIGSRFDDKGSIFCVPSTKTAANFFARALINKILGANFLDVASGMRVLGSRMLRFPFGTSNFSISFELLRSAHLANMKICEHPIHVRYDASELMATSAKELMDLLKYSVGITSVATEIETLIEKVSNWRPITAQCGAHTILAHPLQCNGVYVFQMQDPWYKKVLPITPDVIL